MSVITDNALIAINKGDYLEFLYQVDLGSGWESEYYQLQPGDMLLFSVCAPGQSFEHGVIRKILTDSDLDALGNVKIVFKESDTANLLPGNYYYEIKLISNDKVFTLVNKRKFVIFE